jgi:hypothetical protein
MSRELWPGTRVMAFDSLLFKDDISTPLKYTTRAGIVVKWYGEVSEWMERECGRENALYPDLVDIKFDHREQISHGHFSDGVEIICTD